MNALAEGGGGGGAIVFLLIELAVFVLLIAGAWKVFAKAGKPGWACIVPIYNYMVAAEIAGKPSWWGVLCLIPIVNIIVLAIIAIGIANAFGKSAGFGIGLWLLNFIFWPILGFGSAQYQGAPR